MDGERGFSETEAGTVGFVGAEGTRGGVEFGYKWFPSVPPTSERETTR